MGPLWGFLSRKTAVTSAVEIAGSGFYTSLPSHCLTSTGSFSTLRVALQKEPFEEFGRLTYGERGQASAIYASNSIFRTNYEVPPRQVVRAGSSANANAVSPTMHVRIHLHNMLH
ncbi:hypothetical protein CSKR_203283 [Clonorchis sinensis]|uniref:Uncharacterized protein n=1 Tax=Clonorchis sinensis TaxID=79923 RepID=A0A8T1MAG8_CLOSI|nr:hypothetical protein CSKR_203283 [Clonorchis sinensis]